MDAASVARVFETSRRREDLTFNHHREVAALPPDEADALLDWCEETPKPRGGSDKARRRRGPLYILAKSWTRNPVLCVKLLKSLARPRGIEPLFSP
jgi:hypothetical protein